MQNGKRHRRGAIINPQHVNVPKTVNEKVENKIETPKKKGFSPLFDNFKKMLKTQREKAKELFKELFNKIKNRITNSQKIKNALEFFDFILLKTQAFTKDFREEMFVSWRQVRKRLLAALTVCAVLTFVTTLFYKTLSIGYDIYVNGKSIGVTESISEATRLYNIALSAGKESLSSGDFSLEKPRFYLRFVKKGAFTDDKAIVEAFLSTSDKFIEGYAVVADGEVVFSLLDEKDAYRVLSSYKAQYINENTIGEVTFDKNVEVVKKQIPLNSVLSKDGALDYIELNQPFKVVTQERVVENISIPYEVAQTPDSSMYKGEKKVVSKGENGEKVVETIISKVNGEETEKVVASETVTKEPVVEVVLVGSKEKPKGFATGVFMRPYNGTLTSRFGSRWGRKHEGIDIGGKVGDPVKAADGGKVIYAGWMSGYGNFVKIDHGNGYVTAYGHLSKINTSVGKTVEKGEVIGLLGNTGRSTGPHLHFEVIKNGKHVDPLSYLK